MHFMLMALALCAEPAPALTSLSGLNITNLKPWLIEQVPTLGQCVLPTVKEGDDEVSVQAQFGKSPEVFVTRVDATLSDVACVRGVVESWKRDGKQPAVGPFAFKYRFRPSDAQREGVAVQARVAFTAMCPKLPQTLTVEAVRSAMNTTKPRLPTGARVSIEDALSDVSSLPTPKVSVAISRALRDIVAQLGAEQCIRTAP